MHPRIKWFLQILRLLGAALLLLLLGLILLVACNCRDAPPPDPGDLESALPVVVPANSNGWYFIREAVQDSWIPTQTDSLSRVWYGEHPEAAGIRELIASNQLALSWIDRAARSSRIAPPREMLPEDGNWLGWSPVSRCGRLLRLRAELALIEGRTNDAVCDYTQSLRMARLYLECPPASELDALAAFVEVRNAIHALRDASARLEAGLVWDRFSGELRELSDLREARRRASAAAWAADRRELELLQRIASGAEPQPVLWHSPFATILPDDAQLAKSDWLVRLVFGTLRLLPVSYRLQPNRTLAVMAEVRRGGPLPPGVQNLIRARNSPRWWDILAPAKRLLGPNGLGERHILGHAERQKFIIGGMRLAECAARGARLAFALRRYEQEHGELPEELSVLVSAWCDNVPTDPYDGQPFRYDRKRRLVYSVGPNRRDDSGHDDVLFPVPR